MATGDTTDIARRLKRALPRWFGADNGPTPVLDALLDGIATGLSFIHSLIAYSNLQVRLATATGGWLELWANDFFGGQLIRSPGQGDDSYRAAIRARLMRPAGTRAALIQAITALTGQAPRVFEPMNPTDTGAYNEGHLAYNRAGGYGSLTSPYEAFVTVYRATASGPSYIAGYNISTGAYSQGSLGSRAAYVGADSMQGSVLDQDIYDTIEAVRAAGITVWVAITNASQGDSVPVATNVDLDFSNPDQSGLLGII